jgi:TonB family protein
MKRIHLLFAFLATMSAWSQGIQIDCGYPDKSCYQQLTIKDIDTSSNLFKSTFTGNDAYTKFMEQGLWNQPAAYLGADNKTYFNYFATLVPNAFTPIKNREYRMLAQKDYDSRMGWYTGGKLIGNNQITYDSINNLTYTLNQKKPIWVVKTDTAFLSEIGATMSYDQILKTHNKYKYLENAENYLFQIISYSDTLMSFLKNQSTSDRKWNYRSEFDFKGSNIFSQTNEEDFVSVELNKTIESWSNNYYLQDSSSLIRIPTWKEFDISVRKYEKPDTTSFTHGESIFFDFDKISSAYNIPKKNQIQYKSTSIKLSINSQNYDLYSTSVLTDINNIGKMTGNLKALWGGAHSTFKKNIKFPCILPSLTIGSIGLTAISIGCRYLLYQVYLKAPNERGNYYRWANGFNKSIVPLMGLYAIGATIDLKLAMRDKKRLNHEFKELKGINNACCQSVDAEFPGGVAAMNKFINDNLDYPQEAIDLSIKGLVTVRFNVEETGRVSNVSVATPLAGCKACDLAAVKVVEKMPSWTPAKNVNGSSESVWVTLPINFNFN